MKNRFENELIRLEIERTLQVDHVIDQIGQTSLVPLHKESKKKFLEFMRRPRITRDPDYLEITGNGVIHARWLKDFRNCSVTFLVDSTPIYEWFNKPFLCEFEDIRDLM